MATTPQEMAEWLAPLIEAGVDVLHYSQRRFWEPEFADIDGPRGLNFTGWAKKLTDAATISVGSVGLQSDFMGAFGGQGSGAATLGDLQERLEREEFDLIAVGRVLISDAQWVSKPAHPSPDNQVARRWIMRPRQIAAKPGETN